MLTSLFSWETLFGQTFSDELIFKGLLAENLVEVDEEALKNKYAVGALLSFLKFYLPEITVIPLIIFIFEANNKPPLSCFFLIHQGGHFFYKVIF